MPPCQLQNKAPYHGPQCPPSAGLCLLPGLTAHFWVQCTNGLEFPSPVGLFHGPHLCVGCFLFFVINHIPPTILPPDLTLVHLLSRLTKTSAPESQVTCSSLDFPISTIVLTRFWLDVCLPIQTPMLQGQRQPGFHAELQRRWEVLFLFQVSPRYLSFMDIALC